MFTKRSQRGKIIQRNAMTAEKLFLAKIIWIDMLRFTRRRIRKKTVKIVMPISHDHERHVKTVHEKVKQVKSKVGFGTFVRREKVKVTKQFLCNECSKTFNSFANLKRHFGAKRNLLRHQKSVHKASEEENTARNLYEPQNSLGLNMVNMDLNSVDLSDLLVMPFDPLPFDPLK